MNCELKKDSRLNHRYRICQSLGQGGFGITYLAKDEAFEQYVVIKEYFPIAAASRDAEDSLILPAEKEDRKKFEEGMKRFLREAQILASLLEIPGVVKVLDYFKENKTAYIVMEYVKGISLRTYLERTGEEFSFDRACRMLLPVIAALEKIHKKGLLHRDINPDNIMVEENGSVKLLDFGAAREYYQSQESERTRTILLKSGYAPPEQYEGKGHQGPWTDIYGLCATIYEMMTGCMPPDARTRQVKEELYAPSCYGAAITPQQEERFLKKGLALDYRQRYASIREFLADVFPEQRRKDEKKKRIWRGLAAGLIAAATGAVFLPILQKEETPTLPLAGNYDRGSREYAEFLDFVRENAVEVRRIGDGTETEAGLLSDAAETGEEDAGLLRADGVQTAVLYTLDEAAVRELGVPANGYYLMDWGVREILDILEEKGYSFLLKASQQNFKVIEEPYGVLKSDFTVRESYEVPGGAEFDLCFDYISGRVSDIYILPEADKSALHLSLTADLLDGLLTGLPEEIRKTAEDFSRGIAEYNKQSANGALVYYAWDFEEIRVRLFRAEEGTERAGFHISRREENAPPYNW